MRSFRTEGIIVKRHNLGEADRIVTVFTPTYGKLTIKAAGVRKITSRRSAHIELLNSAMLNLYKGKGMHVLTEVKMIDDYSSIKSDFTKIGMAYHICELIDTLCPENQENINVFHLLKRTLNQLAQKDSALVFPQRKYQDIEDYTLGTYGIGLQDASQMYHTADAQLDPLQHFELTLLSELGYWDKHDRQSQNIDTQAMIESIIERKLKSRSVFSKLQ